MKPLILLLTLFVLLPVFAEQEPSPAPVRRDPFAFQSPEAGTGGLVAAPPGAIPAGIRVLGILTVEGRDPMAVLLLPGKDAPVFVRQNDVIQIDEPPSRARAVSEAESNRQVYLLITRVSDQEVELAPRTRPEDIRIYR
jgi:hypothetical protein